MPMPSAIPNSWFIRRVFNPSISTFAGRIPPLGLIVHTGRSTGRQHRTPVLAFRRQQKFAVAMVYGCGTDWQRNIEVAGRGQVISGGATYPVTNPRLVTGPEALDAVPAWLRPALRLVRVDTVLCLDMA